MSILHAIKSSVFAAVQSEPPADNAFCAAPPDQQKEVTDLLTECGIACYQQMKPDGSHKSQRKWKKATKKMAKRIAKERDAAKGGS